MADPENLSAQADAGKQLSPLDRWDAVLSFQGVVTGNELKVLNALAKRDAHGPGNLKIGVDELAEVARLKAADPVKACEVALTGLRRKGIISTRRRGRGNVSAFTIHYDRAPDMMGGKPAHQEDSMTPRKKGDHPDSMTPRKMPDDPPKNAGCTPEKRGVSVGEGEGEGRAPQARPPSPSINSEDAAADDGGAPCGRSTVAALLRNPRGLAAMARDMRAGAVAMMRDYAIVQVNRARADDDTERARAWGEVRTTLQMRFDRMRGR